MVKSTETTGSVEERECREVASSKKKKQSTLWEGFEKDDLDCSITLSQEERELKQYLGISRLPHSQVLEISWDTFSSASTSL